MKKAAKRAKSKSSSKRAKAKSKTKTTKVKRSSKSSKKSPIPKAGAKLKRVATKAAVAAGVAAIGTALSELKPDEKRAEEDASDENEPKRGSR